MSEAQLAVLNYALLAVLYVFFGRVMWAVWSEVKGPRLGAEANRRSINSEAIACLESVLLPRKSSATVHASKAQAIREALKGTPFKPEDIEQFKQAGRP